MPTTATTSTTATATTLTQRDGHPRLGADAPPTRPAPLTLAATQAFSDELRADPPSAAFQFRTSSHWLGGARIATTCAGYVRDGLFYKRSTPHVLHADEPVALLGAGSAVGPTGHLLHALAHSLALSMCFHAHAFGVSLDGLEIEAEGCLDLQGLLALDERVRPGFKTITLQVRASSSSPDAALRRLLAYARARSPIFAAITQPMPIAWTFEVETCESTPEPGELRHGVNVTALEATLEALRERPVLGKCRFYTGGSWRGATTFASTSPGFDQAEGELLVQHRDPVALGNLGDTPSAWLGEDTGACPEETLLHGMAGCVSVTTSYHAAARGLRLEAFDVELEADVDLRGFADLNDHVGSAPSAIRAHVFLRAGGDEDELREFLRFTTAHSPMCNSVCRPVQVDCELLVNGRPA